ncbi:MAG TPA: hypothetical protein PLO23_09185, partial [Alphaproteobacteria bacterium]|nr:hypothetical protein [Alphaproteobacteria bacterium]
IAWNHTSGDVAPSPGRKPILSGDSQLAMNDNNAPLTQPVAEGAAVPQNADAMKRIIASQLAQMHEKLQKS